MQKMHSYRHLGAAASARRHVSDLAEAASVWPQLFAISARRSVTVSHAGLHHAVSDCGTVTGVFSDSFVFPPPKGKMGRHKLVIA